MRFWRSWPLLQLPIILLIVCTLNGDAALGAESRHHQCVTDPMTFVLAADSEYPGRTEASRNAGKLHEHFEFDRRTSDALKHHDISGRLRAFLKADKTVDYFTFEQRTGYPALDAAAVDALAKWQFTKAGECDIVTIPFTFTVKHSR